MSFVFNGSVVASTISTGGSLNLGSRRRPAGSQTFIHSGAGVQVNIPGAVVGAALSGRELAASLTTRERIVLIDGIEIEAKGDKKRKLTVILEPPEGDEEGKAIERVVECAAVVINITGNTGDISATVGDIGVGGNAANIKATSGHVEVKGNVAGNASSTGGEVRVLGDVGGDARSTGGDVIAETIVGNATTTAGSIRANSIAGAATSAFGTVTGRDDKRKRSRG
jgi:hypothetical protein